METVAAKKLNKGDGVKWIVTFALPIMVMLIPTNEAFNSNIRLFLALTLFAILTFAFDNINQTVVALCLPILYVVCDLAPATVAFSPWLQYIPWMSMGGFVLAAVLDRIGLLRRLACHIILLTGAKYIGIIWGLAIAGVVCAIAGVGVIPVFALSYGVCKALDTGVSKTSAGILLSAAMGVLMTNTYLFLGPMIPIGVGMSVTGPMDFLGFFEAFYVNAPSILGFVIMIFILGKMTKPEKDIDGKDYFKDQLAKMGSMTMDEKKSAAVTILLLLFCITSGKLHHIEVGWGFVLIPAMLFLPLINVGKPEDIKGVNWPFMFFVTACMGIGAVAGALGLGKLIADTAMPLLQGKSYYVYFIFEWVLIVAGNFLLTPLAMQAAFTVPLVQIAAQLGINPMAVYYIMMNGCDQIIMPYEYALYLIFFSVGLIRMKDFMQILGVKMILNFVIVFALLIPFWKFIGFIFV